MAYYSYVYWYCLFLLRAGEVNRFVEDPRWATQVMPLLTGDTCTGGLIPVGHSLGGAIASLFAACSNWAGKINQAVDSQVRG